MSFTNKERKAQVQAPERQPRLPEVKAGQEAVLGGRVCLGSSNQTSKKQAGAQPQACVGTSPGPVPAGGPIDGETRPPARGEAEGLPLWTRGGLAPPHGKQCLRCERLNWSMSNARLLEDN